LSIGENGKGRFCAAFRVFDWNQPQWPRKNRPAIVCGKSAELGLKRGFMAGSRVAHWAWQKDWRVTFALLETFFTAFRRCS
ncbi:MAG: hypothetical protein ABSG59_17060, partial [Verrucomicrobiota bacterium]